MMISLMSSRIANRFGLSCRANNGILQYGENENECRFFGRNYATQRCRAHSACGRYLGTVAAQPEEVALTEAQTQELDRRLEAHRQDPSAGASWQEVQQRVRQIK